MSSFLYATQTKKYSAQEFLDLVRRNHPVETWGLMSGEVSHKRRDEDLKTSPIKLGIRFTDSRVLAKITIGEGKKEESYTVGQPYNGDAPSIITSGVRPSLSELSDYGLKPEDLTMAFIYWKFDKELPGTTLKGMDCRVFLLSNPTTKEKVKVYISSDYYYPMEAEWIKEGENTPYRTCFINSFTKVNSLWTPDSFYLEGPGWRTNVEFDKINLGYTKDGIPKGLFD